MSNLSKLQKSLPGTLTTRGAAVPVEVRYATKYSVLVVVKEKTAMADIADLALDVDHQRVSLGPCRIILETENRGGVLHVMPISKFHNFEKLFFRSKIDTLEASSLNLPLLINYKNEIRPEFKEYVSNLSYDLSIYSFLLGQMDKSSRDEPLEVREFIQNTFLKSLGGELTAYLGKSLKTMEGLVSGFSEKEQEHHGFYFRRQLWHFLLQAPLMARTNLKPRGYSGDSEMMRLIYQNDHQGESTFGKILHKFSTEQPAAQSVRNRRREVVARLKSFEKTGGVKPEQKVRILSVACGPAVEIRDLVRSPEDCARYHFSLLDQDQQALAEAVTLINIVEKSFGAKISLDIIRESARIMLVNPDFLNRWGSFHFIYSMGLFDYFTTPVASAVLVKLYELLLPGGEMVIGNLHPKNPSRWYMEYWHDWKIIYRTEEELLELAAEIKGARSAITFDETGIQMFLTVKKASRP